MKSANYIHTSKTINFITLKTLKKQVNKKTAFLNYTGKISVEIIDSIFDINSFICRVVSKIDEKNSREFSITFIKKDQNKDYSF